MDKKEIDYLLGNEYLYTRTKSIIKERNKEEILFLHAALIIKKYRMDSDSKIFKSMKPIYSELIELPISKMPEYTKLLKVGTIGIDMKKEEFYRLLQEAKNDIEALFTYKALE
ncbi:hypothetical protein [Cytobacillus solani]|uniref:Uncharacterized protein n=2 Tax=Cytobacillus solani TaxID=1637975 RepID=A0A0Q3VGR7_9BACI|nr:hypothetical protein [Cytobacillus solani]KQL18431.1 hypothetical protein AN957_07510 [Cytobacillus solani]